MATVDQFTLKPNRKISAVMWAGAISSVINVAMMQLIPDFTTPEVQVLIQALVMAGAGYMVREHA